MENRKPDSQLVDELTVKVYELKVALVDDPNMPGVKGAIERIFDKFAVLPNFCHIRLNLSLRM